MRLTTRRYSFYALAGGAGTLLAGIALVAPRGRPSLVPAQPIVRPPDSHEPAGFTPISRRGFDAKVEAGWTDRGDRNFRIVADSTAPVSPPKVGEAQFPMGHPSGSGPISTGLVLRTRPTELYLSFWVKLSPNWVGNDAGVNKIFFVWMHDNPVVALSAQGIGGAPLEPQVRLQNTPVGARNLRPNLGAAAIVRGRWQRWELVLRANRPGRADGSAEWWIDGKRLGAYTDIVFAGPRETNAWQELVWNPTYGGAGRPVTALQTMRIDEVYVSGR